MWHATIKVWIGIFTVLSVTNALANSLVGFVLCTLAIGVNLSILYLTEDASSKDV